MNELKVMSYDLRKDVVDMIMSGKGGHIGGGMSIMDILVTLYFKVMNISPENQDDPNRDRFILSKGHSVETLYAVLAKKGFFPIEEVIEKFSKFGSPYIGHPNNKLPGIEMNSGSLGHGLPVAVGMALAGKMGLQGLYRHGRRRIGGGLRLGRSYERQPLQAGQFVRCGGSEPPANLRLHRRRYAPR